MSLVKGGDETEFFNTSSSITLGPNTVDDDIWSRAYAPKEVDPMVYNISCCYLGIIGVVGILGNAARTGAGVCWNNFSPIIEPHLKYLKKPYCDSALTRSLSRRTIVIQHFVIVNITQSHNKG
ncbi:PSMC6 [Lepeophtheirus salmonis]|uniref:PSMC6 n=1 Tax=Lepeophtheirus salmonis TaxID=72036 RepID=A0A7R8CXX4_LEPSM|nr:PSMC6 [Lepeophtheirus salmonis]CAF2919067.1 PSMC6 [Lepeophtheirus salmonis]